MRYVCVTDSLCSCRRRQPLCLLPFLDQIIPLLERQQHTLVHGPANRRAGHFACHTKRHTAKKSERTRFLMN
jgi:hypothetical protein